MMVVAVPPFGDQERRRLRADFLKRHRARVSPNSVNLPTGPRRRAKGLLREEVAHLAGIGVTWYTWLEQARDINPSTEVMKRIAEALQLDDAEIRYLLQLSLPRDRAVSHLISAELASWLDGLKAQPAYVLNGRWEILAWNEPADTLFGFSDFGDRPTLLGCLFLEPSWRVLFLDWELVAADCVGQFREVLAHAPSDSGLLMQIDTLTKTSDEFARLWRSGAVSAGQMKTKRMRHERLGEITLTYASLRPQGVPDDLSVTVYSPISSGR